MNFTKLLAATALLLGVIFGGITVLRSLAAEEIDDAAQKAAIVEKRVQMLEADLDHFVLQLQFEGAQHKPYYSLSLSVQPVQSEDPFYPRMQIQKRQAQKLIEHLKDGFLSEAIDMGHQNICWSGPRYVLTVKGKRMELAEDLDWNSAMYSRIEVLRKVLDEEPGKAMDLLMGRLAGHLQEWQTPEQK